MKVAHIVGKLKTAGVESVVFTYLRHMPIDGMHIDVLYDADSTSAPPSDLIEKGIRFIEIPPYQHLPSYLSELKQIFKESGYDIVHSHMNALSVFSLWAASRAGIKNRICHNHTTTSPAEPARNLVKLALRPFSKLAATHLAACSELSGRWLFGDKAYDAGQVKLFYNAVDIGRFSFCDDWRREIRGKLGVKDELLLGHVGRFFDTKNHPFLIDILSECRARGVKAKLLLIGSGETQDSVRKRAEERGVLEDVIFTGLVSDTERYYSAMDIFLLPSFYEGLPVVAMEAQASGLECILSDTVTRECAITENVSFLPISDGVGAWCSLIERYSPHDRTAGQRFFEKSKFNIDNSARDMVEYYNSILYGKNLD